MTDQMKDNFAVHDERRVFHLDGKSNLSEVVQYQGRTLHIIFGQHYSAEAINYFQQHVEEPLNQPGTNPNKWLFLVEGGEYQGNRMSEVLRAQNFAASKKIPVFDPIISHTKEIVDLAIKRMGLKIKNPVIMRQIMSAVTVDSLRETYRKPIEHFIRHCGFNPDDVQKGLELLRAMSADEQALLVHDAHQNLSDLSNVVSIQELDLLIQQNPTRTEILLMIGSGHVPMLTQLRSLDQGGKFSLTKEELDNIRKKRNEHVQQNFEFEQSQLK